MKQIKPFDNKDYRPFTLSHLQTNQKEEVINFFSDLMYAMSDQFRLELIFYLRRHHATLEELLVEFPVHENDLLFQLKTLVRFGLLYLEKEEGCVVYYLLTLNFPPGMLEDIDPLGNQLVLPEVGMKWYQLYSFTISNAGRLN